MENMGKITKDLYSCTKIDLELKFKKQGFL